MQIKLRTQLILFAFFIFLLEWLLSPPIQTQISFLIIILVLFGIPHGALDLYIHQHLVQTDKYQKLFLFRYISNIVVYAAIWYCFPIMALLLFIFITAYHFGEIDWMGKTETVLHKIIYTVLGLSWILFLLTRNIHFAMDIFLTMGRSTFKKDVLVDWANKIYPISIGLIGFMYIVLFLGKSYFFSKPIYYYYALLQTLVLFAFVLLTPLWVSFTFYFGFWHSLLSFDKIRINFNLPNTLNGWSSLLLKAAPFSIMAWIGFGYLTFLTLTSKDTNGIFTLLFISLSVLALPHLQVFTKLKLED